MTSHHIVDMLAVSSSIGTNACSYAEFIVGDELGPLMELLLVSKYISIDETADRIAVSISTVIIQFSSFVTSRDVNLGEISDAGDLDIFWCLDKVNSSERSCRHDTSAVCTMRAVSNGLAFNVADRVLNGWAPKAKVVQRVDPQGLTL